MTVLQERAGSDQSPRVIVAVPVRGLRATAEELRDGARSLRSARS